MWSSHAVRVLLSSFDTATMEFCISVRKEEMTGLKSSTRGPTRVPKAIMYALHCYSVARGQLSFKAVADHFPDAKVMHDLWCTYQ